LKKASFFLFPLLLILFAINYDWTVKSSEVNISFEVPKNGKKGTINGLEADIKFNPLDLLGSKVTAKVDVNSINANNEGLTSHLLEPDFFDAKQFPFILFESTEIIMQDSIYTAFGNLTMKGVTHNEKIMFKFQDTDSLGFFSGKLNLFCGDYNLISNKVGDSTTLANININVPVFRK